MDNNTARALISLNNRFYHDNADSFSQTRQYSWPGWNALLGVIGTPPRDVLDVACGNMRFKAFLDKSLDSGSYSYTGLDNCIELVELSQREHFVRMDILETLLPEAAPSGIDPLGFKARTFDLVVCFGFMHHVPGIALRERLLSALLETTRPSGYCAISLWQFERDTRVLSKARTTTERGSLELGIALDKGDHLLDWKGSPRSYRYCHGFSNEEVAALADYARAKARLVARYNADGRTGDANAYLVFTR